MFSWPPFLYFEKKWNNIIFRSFSCYYIFYIVFPFIFWQLCHNWYVRNFLIYLYILVCMCVYSKPYIPMYMCVLLFVIFQTAQINMSNIFLLCFKYVFVLYFPLFLFIFFNAFVFWLNFWCPFCLFYLNDMNNSLLCSANYYFLLDLSLCFQIL